MIDHRQYRGLRGGLTLIEVTVVMVLLTFLLSLIATTLWSTIRIERADSAAFQRSMFLSTLADQFRGDVAEATEAPATVAEHKAGANCLILKRPTGDHVVYVAKERGVERFEITGAGAHLRPMPVGADWKTEFARDDNMITLRFAELRKGMWIKHPVEYGAALGGDLK